MFSWAAIQGLLDCFVFLEIIAKLPSLNLHQFKVHSRLPATHFRPKMCDKKRHLRRVWNTQNRHNKYNKKKLTFSKDSFYLIGPLNKTDESLVESGKILAQVPLLDLLLFVVFSPRTIRGLALKCRIHLQYLRSVSVDKAIRQLQMEGIEKLAFDNSTDTQ